MVVVGVAVAFGSVMYLASKRVALWLSLLAGTGILGLLSQMGLPSFTTALADGLFSPMTVQLVLAVALISGLGKVMKESGDLELMVGSLVALFPRPKVLTMLLPALIGTINVPGGAIMSAPMVEENGKALGLNNAAHAAVNLFFRHIGYFVYPLHTSIIVLSELLALPKQAIIRANFVPMLAAVITAYFFFFRGKGPAHGEPNNETNAAHHLKGFLLGFSPVMVILGLVLIFDLPFYLATAVGLLLALIRGIQAEHWGRTFLERLKQLVTSGIDYKLALAILSLMLFKSIVEASGATSILAASLLNYGIPLPVLVILLGLLAGYILGTHLAAAGILAPFFAPLLPQAALAPYTSLLLISIMLGYLVSPLHLCLVLTTEYFDVPYGQTLRKLAVPLLTMLAAALVRLLLAL